MLSFGFERPYFLTFNQVKQLGASIKKGSKSFMVIF
ncbi:ArdC family protein [Carboxylicivirga marina]